jgi:hypothetical protein
MLNNSEFSWGSKMNSGIRKTIKNGIEEIKKASKSLDMYALATIVCLALAIGFFLQKDMAAGLGWLVAAIISCLSAYREIVLKKYA